MAPDLPELQLTSMPGTGGGLVLEGALVDASECVVAIERLDLLECELRGVGFDSTGRLEVRLRDAVLGDCDLSNLTAHEGAELMRVLVRQSRLIGTSFAGAKLRDVAFSDCMLSLGSFAFAELQDVSFERVNLREASFMEAQLDGVSFISCQFEGADFRRVVMRDCLLRGSSLEGVLGVESLRGLTMPLDDVMASAPALAAALGIEIEQ
jgi:uncharacterized protein YjbI with pentapeptide repeats